MRHAIAIPFLIGSCVFFIGCSHTGIKALSTHDEAKYPGTAAANYKFSWTLPKTLFDVEATWTFKSCTAVRPGVAMLEATPHVQIIGHAVPDPEIGFVSLDPAASNSFWKDHGFDVKTEDTTHLLQSFNSSSSDQTGAIVGNVMKGVSAIAAVAIAATASAGEKKGPAPLVCGGVAKTKETIDKLQAKLAASPDQTTSAAKALEAQIVNLQKRLTITLDTLTVDPGFDPKTKLATPIINGEVATLDVPEAELRAKGWINATNQDVVDSFRLHVILKFAEAKPDEVPADTKKPLGLTRDGMWREVAYIPVIVINSATKIDGTQNADPVDQPTTLPFAQFGKSRTLPLDAPAFGKAEWTITFNKFGEVTEAKWNSQATGTGMSQVFADSAATANSVVTDTQKAPPTDRATQKLQADNTKMGAKIDYANKMPECLALKAKGQVDSCP